MRIRFTWFYFIIFFLTVALTSCAHKVSPDAVEKTFTLEKEHKQTLLSSAGSEMESANKANSPIRGLGIERMNFFNSDIFFNYDSASLDREALSILNDKMVFLQNHPDFNIQIEGHCDERGTAEYNLALGERRAQAARDYLVMKGLVRDRITIISYGMEKPLDFSHTEKAWASNRRAHFNLLNAGDSTSLPGQ